MMNSSVETDRLEILVLPSFTYELLPLPTYYLLCLRRCHGVTIRLFEVGPSVKSTQVLGTSNDKRMDVTEGVCRLMLEQ